MPRSDTLARSLWTTACVLLAMNLGLLGWLWVSPPPAEPAAPAPVARSIVTLPATHPPEPPPSLSPEAQRLVVLIENSRKSLGKPPDAKALAIMRNNLDGRFAVLYRMLELDEAGLAQVKPLLLERHQLEEKARLAILAAGTIPSPQELQAAQRYATELVDAQIVATLGPEKAPVFKSFFVRSDDYRVLDALSAKLSYTDQPLIAEARRALRSAIVASGEPAGFLEPAAGLLTPAQMAELMKTCEAREMRRLRLRLMTQ